MGVLYQGQRTRGGGGLGVYRGAHHQGSRAGVRRLRGQRRRPGCEWQAVGAKLMARRIRWGMVGCGQGAFIGAVHRIAARLDDQYELVAGALSSDPARAHASAAELHIEPGRSYAGFEEMAAREAARPDGIEVVAIVTPNHMHFAPANAFSTRGIHVICDKPLTHRLDDALTLAATVERSGLIFALTHN